LEKRGRCVSPLAQKLRSSVSSIEREAGVHQSCRQGRVELLKSQR